VAALIEATEASLVLQVPPGAASVNVVEEPTQTEVAPVIVATDGAAITPIDKVATSEPQPEDTE
jgi:hypothetical protein